MVDSTYQNIRKIICDRLHSSIRKIVVQYGPSYSYQQKYSFRSLYISYKFYLISAVYKFLKTWFYTIKKTDVEVQILL